MFLAAVLVVVLGITAVVVDLGMERVTRADLQALADTVALDLAREITGRTQAQLTAEGNLANPGSAVRESLNRNADTLGKNVDLQIDWGSYDNEVWNTAPDPPTAVKVVANADTDYAVFGGEGEVTRTAYAVASSSACYKLGSFVAAINSDDSTVLEPLEDLFGVKLDLVSYKALAAAEVNLADLAAAPTIGSPTALLTGTITYSNLISALISVLSKDSTANSVAISALDKILGVSAVVGAISLGNVLHVAPTDTAALGMDLNVLDIVGSARLANGDHFIEVENIQAGVPGVGFQFTGGIKLISAAQLACGKPNTPESVADNAQLEGDLGITFVNLPSLSIPGLATLQTTKGTGSLHVNLADGTGQLVAPPDVHCGDGTASDPHTYSVAVQTQPASYSLRSDIEVTGDVKASELNALGLGGLLSGLLGILLPNAKVTLDIKVRFDIATNYAGGTSIANLGLPPNDTTPYETGSTVYLDPRNVVPTVTEVSIGGKLAPLNQVLVLTNMIVNDLTTANNAFMGKTLVPLIDNINNTFVGPVARMVGLRFGGADVWAVGAVCGEPDLWG